MKASYVDDSKGSVIFVDASKRNHDDRLNCVMDEFYNKKIVQKHADADDHNRNRKINEKQRNKQNDSDDDDIVGMMDRLNRK